MDTIGLDLHKRESQLCIGRDDGQIMTLEARSLSQVVVPHVDPEQRLCSFGSRRRPHVDAVPILFAPASLAQAPTAAPPAGGRSSAHGSRVGKVCRQDATQNRLATPPSMFNAQIRKKLCCRRTP